MGKSKKISPKSGNCLDWRSQLDILPLRKRIRALPKMTSEGWTELGVKGAHIILAQEGDDESLNSLMNLPGIRKHVWLNLQRWFIPGKSREDLVEIMRFEVWNATCIFDPMKGTFEAIAKVCMDRGLQNEMATSNRKKQKPLNSALSADSPGCNEDGRELSFWEVLCPQTYNPFEENEWVERLNEFLEANILTDLEYDVVWFWSRDYTYKEICQELGVNKKSIDNALMRVKRKARKYLEMDSLRCIDT